MAPERKNSAGGGTVTLLTMLLRTRDAKHVHILSVTLAIALG